MKTSSDKSELLQNRSRCPSHNTSPFLIQRRPIKPAFKLCELNSYMGWYEKPAILWNAQTEVTLHRNKGYLMYVWMPRCGTQPPKIDVSEGNRSALVQPAHFSYQPPPEPLYANTHTHKRGIVNPWHDKFVQAEITSILADIVPAELAFNVCITGLMSLSVNIRLCGYVSTEQKNLKKARNVPIIKRSNLNAN